MPFDLAERFIGAAEEKLGAPLPHSYRQAMMASNGGEVTAYDGVWSLYPILDTSDRKRLSRSCNDILRETRVMRDWPGWPENAVAIAVTRERSLTRSVPKRARSRCHSRISMPRCGDG